MKSRYLTIGESAKYLSVSIDTVRRWDKSGKIKSQRLDGKNRYFDVADLDTLKFDGYLSAKEAAEKLNMSPTTLRRLADDGTIKSNRAKNSYRQFKVKDIEAYLSTQDHLVEEAKVTEVHTGQENISEVVTPETKELLSNSPKVRSVVAVNAKEIKKLGRKFGLFSKIQIALLLGITLILLVLGLAFVISPDKASKFFDFKSKAQAINSSSQVLGAETEKKSPISEITAAVFQGPAEITVKLLRIFNISKANDILLPGEEVYIGINQLNNSQLNFTNRGLQLAQGGVGLTEINKSVAGVGLIGGEGSPISVNTDNMTIEIKENALTVKNNSINNQRIGNDAVSSEKIKDGSITTEKLADQAVTAEKIANRTIIFSKWSRNGCLNNQLPKWNESSLTWVCADDFGIVYGTDNQGLDLTNNQFAIVLDGTTITKSALGLKINDNYDDNFALITGAYADPAWITSLSGAKVSGNISGNSANVNGVVGMANGGTGLSLAGAAGNLLQSTGAGWASWTPNYLTGNQTIFITGDATGSGTTSIGLTLANSGVTLGTYNNVTVNTKGIITGASNVAYAPESGSGNYVQLQASTPGTAQTGNFNISGTGIVSTIIGSTAASGNLTLSSTSNATKGKILFGTSAYDEVNNRLGIGTTSPAEILDVAGNLRVRHSSDANYNIVTSIGTLSNTASFEMSAASGSFYNLGLVTNNQTWNATGGGIIFMPKEVEKMRIDQNGNVGIGTTSPGAKLSVIGEGTGTALIGSGGFGGNYTAMSLNGTLSNTSYNFLSSPTDVNLYINSPGYIAFRNSNNDLVRITTTGKVGIGTTSPTNILSLGNAAAQKFWIENSATDVVGRALTIAAGGTIAGTSTDDVAGGNLILQSGLGTGTGASTISFQTGTTLTTGKTLQTMSTKMTILGNGNVGIGTASPMAGYKLDVNGSIKIANGEQILLSTSGNFIAAGELYSAAGNQSFTYYNGSVKQTTMTLTNTGNVGIGTASPGAMLQVNAGVAATKGLIVKGATSQSANLQDWQNSTGQIQGYVSSVGDLVFNTTDGANMAVEYARNTVTSAIRIRNAGTTVIQLHGDSGTPTYFNAGNVGIGTTNILGGKFQVKAATDENLAIAGHLTYSSGVLLNAANDAWSANVPMELRASSFDFTVGNVGIGTTSPQKALDVTVVGSSGAVTTAATFGLTTNPGGVHTGTAIELRWRNLNNEGVKIAGYHNGTGATMGFYTGSTPTENMTINHLGNVGIGTASPNYKLDVAGDIRIAGTGKLYFGDAATYYFSLNGTTLESNTAFKANGNIETTGSFSLGGGVTWSKGAGAPIGACTTGSLYSRTDGAASTTLYVCENSAWAPK
jgi:excisionase family DNA binding protein